MAKEKQGIKLTAAQHLVAKEIGFPDWQKLNYNLKKLYAITEKLLANGASIGYQEDGDESIADKDKRYFDSLYWVTSNHQYTINNLNFIDDDENFEKREELEIVIAVSLNDQFKTVLEKKVVIKLSDDIEISVKKIRENILEAYSEVNPKFKLSYKKYGWYVVEDTLERRISGESESIGYYYGEESGDGNGDIYNPEDLDQLLFKFALWGKSATALYTSWKNIFEVYTEESEILNLSYDGEKFVPKDEESWMKVAVNQASKLESALDRKLNFNPKILEELSANNGKFGAIQEDILKILENPLLPQEYAYAYKKTGLMLTEINQPFFSEKDKKAWREAIAEYNNRGKV